MSTTYSDHEVAIIPSSHHPNNLYWDFCYMHIATCPLIEPSFWQICSSCVVILSAGSAKNKHLTNFNSVCMHIMSGINPRGEGAGEASPTPHPPPPKLPSSLPLPPNIVSRSFTPALFPPPKQEFYQMGVQINPLSKYVVWMVGQPLNSHQLDCID
jgi:hypothetical protein